jgi:serine/threonine protein kinase/sugar lactone lactonase YvrE
VSLSNGVRLGPYDVVSRLGAGGMGEVWRARDSRLQREVAIKVLPAELSSDAGRLKRFEKEARSASALNHPNIVTIYDIGQADSVSYIAMELVEGKTLRELLFAGALPVKRVLSIAAQVADGLARAHEAGIVHRDLKPENLMVTKDGRVKILDFGLAKLTHAGADRGEGTNIPTETGTGAGVVLGTVGYMSPEQASGQTVDFRSDQFSFGSILYELVTGKRAFQKKTAVDTLSAILNDEPKPIGSVNAQAPTPLRWIVERCLAKEAAGRYASTHDLARDIGMVRDRLSEAVSGEAIEVRRRGRRLWPLGALGVLAALAGVLLLGRSLQSKPPSPPQFQRLTFRRGLVDAARFSPDGHTIVYSARWDGDPPHIFLTRPEGPESQRLELPDASLLSVSPGGELAIVTGKMPIGFSWWSASGTLATVPLGGGAPREIATDVVFADWAPDGKRMLVVRGRPTGPDPFDSRLEFPLGKVIHRGTARFPRVSPKGDAVAFVADRWNRVHIVDSSGKQLLVSKEWPFIRRLAWSPSGKEVWFTTAEKGVNTLRALSLSGKDRLLLRLPQGVTIEDVSREGRMLLGFHQSRQEVWAHPAGEARERDLTVLGNSDAMGLSPDGRTLLINEGHGVDRLSFYLRRADGSPPKKLGEGMGSELSPDGRWAVVVRPGPPSRLVLVPTGAGEEKTLENGGIEKHAPNSIRWSLNGRRLLFAVSGKDRQDRLYVQDVAGGRPRPVTPPSLHTESSSLSPDGRFVIAEHEDGFWMYPVDGGDRHLVAGLRPMVDFVWRNWSEDGRFVYAWEWGVLPFRVFRVDVLSGRREPWKTIMPQDPAGIYNADLMLTPDGKSYAYNAKRMLSDLYLVEGLQ